MPTHCKKIIARITTYIILNNFLSNFRDKPIKNYTGEWPGSPYFHPN